MPIFPPPSLWGEGRGPTPVPPCIVRHVDIQGDVVYEACATLEEAYRWAADARDDSGADAAIYRLWHTETT